tara:strand:+ start:243 stop:1169 length:927 start_codon:yes stop_codon:yes gene_type:complete
VKISIVTPTFNEIDNIKNLYLDIKKIMNDLNIEYEHIIIDNSSIDGTIELIKNIAKEDYNVKIIINSKNYGHIKSPFHGILQSNGDATILMASDYQDPPHLIIDLINKWRKGSKIVLTEKINSEENKFIYFLRRAYYRFINYISENKLTENTTGSGIFDKSVIMQLKKIDDPYPYFRGLINEISDEITTVKFTQPLRKYGQTKNNLFTLYDIALLGIVKHSRKPLRMMTFIGLTFSLISFLIGIFYLFYKIIFWDTFSVGIAPLIIGMFFFGSFQILLLGLVGEYVGIILLHQRKMPLVVEKERINFN